MKDRLQKFMEIETLTSSRLAEILGVQPSNISHILGGRNRPSFEFIEKMLLRFPKVNPDWLLLGKGPMYRQDIAGQQGVRPAISVAENNLFVAPSQESDISAGVSTSDLFSSQEEDIPGLVEKKRTTASSPKADPGGIESVTIPDSEVERIVIFLKDKSFISYRPK